MYIYKFSKFNWTHAGFQSRNRRMASVRECQRLQLTESWVSVKDCFCGKVPETPTDRALGLSQGWLL